MKVELTPEEVADASSLASQRHEAKHKSVRDTGAISRATIAKGTPLEDFIPDRRYRAHFIGLLGEIAYAKATGGEIDRNIYNSGDSHLGDVGRVEVKTATWMGPDVHLKITEKELAMENQPERYVLARVDEKDFHKVELIGEIGRDDFIEKSVSKQYGPRYPKNKIMDAADLDPIPTQ